jgi:hypothetical protein
MGVRIVWGLAIALTGLTASCLSGSPAQKPSTPAGDVDTGLVATVTLRYQRPDTFRSVGRPESFRVIVDFENASREQQYPGSWNDATQTLSAIVNVPLRVENLVYVVDPAVQPGATTTISAGRGTLKEITCPELVNPLYTCAILQVLH